MDYIARADLETRFGDTELRQIAGEADGTINWAKVEQAIDDACAEIDGYLQGPYTLPLPTVPPNLKRIAADVARYHLYDDRVTDLVADRYKQAIAYLTRVSEGKAQLGVDDQGQAPASGGSPETTGTSATFTLETLEDY